MDHDWWKSVSFWWLCPDPLVFTWFWQAVTNVIGSMDISGWRRKSIIDKMSALCILQVCTWNFMLFCPELCTVGCLLIRILAKNFMLFVVVQNCNRCGLSASIDNYAWSFAYLGYWLCRVAWIVSHNWKIAPSALDIGNPARRKSEYLVAAKFTSPMDSK